MKLALSVRVAEGFGDKRRATASLDDLARIATDNGYAALCMRASQLGTHSPPDEIRRGRQTVDAAGLAVSMVTGDFPIPENHDVHGPEALRGIGPYLDRVFPARVITAPRRARRSAILPRAGRTISRRRPFRAAIPGRPWRCSGRC